jgi:hypothetical protein
MKHTQKTKLPLSELPRWLLEATELKATALGRLSAMPVATRDFPLPGWGWSASEIIEHLILSEELTAGRWKEGVSKLPSAKTGLKAELLARFVAFGMGRTSIRVPTVPGLEPEGGSSITELERRWNTARQQLVEALPEDSNAAWVMHPVFGPLNSAQMGRIIASHLKHHLHHWPQL